MKMTIKQSSLVELGPTAKVGMDPSKRHVMLRLPQDQQAANPASEWHPSEPKGKHDTV